MMTDKNRNDSLFNQRINSAAKTHNNQQYDYKTDPEKVDRRRTIEDINTAKSLGITLAELRGVNV